MPLKVNPSPKKLTDEEEKVLSKPNEKNNDKEARNKLIEHNLRLVAHVAKKI
ncbi:MAG: hypothetical protein L6U99_10880 [Clostridium sp.]|nr:MAG: hypothetical protein L6U99_10880 [Clostridium sp.]